MHTRLLLSLLGLLAPLAAAAQGGWEVLPNSPSAGSPNSGRFEDIEAFTPDSLWIIKGDGRLYRSTDGGASWAMTYTDPEVVFRSLAFADGRRGWIGGISGGGNVLFETNDGGITFANISDRIVGPSPPGLCGLFALDSLAVYGVGGIAGGSHFVRTLDGGQTWTSTDMSTQAGYLLDVHFFDRLRGLAVGATDFWAGPSQQAIVLGTEDGGATWTERFRSVGGPPYGEHGWKLTFPTPEIGYVSVERSVDSPDGRVLKTEDGGHTWVELPVPGTQSMQGIGFLTPEVGWLSGRGSPRVTTDGGLTWSPAPEVRMTTNRFVFFGDTLGYAVADRVLRYRRGAVAAEPPAPPTRVATAPPYPNPTPARVLFPYTLPEPAEVTLDVFDVLGRHVARVALGTRPAGPDELLWLGTDAAGRPVAPGTYGYRLRLGDHETTGTFTKAASAR